MELKEHERIDDLQRKGYRIIQNSKLFCFSIDAVLLADYVTVKKGDKVCDLCSGNGIIPILLCANTGVKEVVGVELLEKSCDLAKRSVVLNGLEDKITIHQMDLKEALFTLPKNSFHAVTCNPPFKEVGGGIASEGEELYIARHEVMATLEDIIKVGSGLLNFAGRFAMIHRPERLCDILCLMRTYKIEPKRIRFVQPNHKKKATMVLVEGVKGGRPKLLVETPLYVFDENGNYTKEIDEIYKREEYAKYKKQHLIEEEK